MAYCGCVCSLNMGLGSVQHQEKAASEKCKNKSCAVWVHEGTFLWEHALEEYIDEALVNEEFEDHLKKEGGALAQPKEELKHNKDEALKLLFQNMEEDEKRHHGIVQILVKNLHKID